MRKRRYRKFKRYKLKFNPRLVWASSAFIFAVIVIIGLGYLIYTSDIFMVKEQDIKSNIALDRSLITKIRDQTLFNLDIKSIHSHILKEHPEYKKVYVLKKFPSTVTIEIEKRIPVAQIKGKKFYPIDSEGVILSNGSSDQLRELIPVEISNYDRFFETGNNIKDERLEIAFDLIKTLKLQDFLDTKGITLVNVIKQESAYFIINSGSFKIDGELGNENIRIIIGGDDFKSKANLLKNIADQELKDKLSLVEYIDLRYKKVYVGFKR